jgi:hypothetical protein
MQDHKFSFLLARAEKLQTRMERSLEAIANFARYAEEFAALHKTAATIEARARIEELLRLNKQTAAVLKRSLFVTDGHVPGDDREGTSPLAQS